MLVLDGADPTIEDVMGYVPQIPKLVPKKVNRMTSICKVTEENDVVGEVEVKNRRKYGKGRKTSAARTSEKYYQHWNNSWNITTNTQEESNRNNNYDHYSYNGRNASWSPKRELKEWYSSAAARSQVHYCSTKTQEAVMWWW